MRGKKLYHSCSADAVIGHFAQVTCSLGLIHGLFSAAPLDLVCTQMLNSMLKRTVLPLVAAVLGCAAIPASAAPGSVRDFQLPPSEERTEAPQPQGPVDTEGGVIRAPRIIRPQVEQEAAPQTGANTEQQTVQPEASADTSPSTVPVASPLAPGRDAPANQPAARPSAREAEAPPPAPSAESGPVEQATADQPVTAPLAEQQSGSSSANRPTVDQQSLTATQSATAALPDMPYWWLLALAVLLALGIVLFAWRKREAAAAFSAEEGSQLAYDAAEPVPQPDTAKPDPANTERAVQNNAPAASVRVAARVPVQLKAEAHALSRSVMNATLSYRLSLRNLGTQTLKDVRVSVDMLTAHGQLPVTEQLPTGETVLPLATSIDAIEARDTYEFGGEFRLPVPAIRPIRQGNALLYVPLLRIRIDAEGREPLLRSFVIGTLPPAGHSKLQPFRLDEMAQTYRNIGMRALD